MKVYTPKHNYSDQEESPTLIKLIIIGLLSGILFWGSFGFILAAFIS